MDGPSGVVALHISIVWCTFLSPWRGRQRKAGAVGSTPTKFKGRRSLHRVQLPDGFLTRYAIGESPSSVSRPSRRLTDQLS